MQGFSKLGVAFGGLYDKAYNICGSTLGSWKLPFQDLVFKGVWFGGLRVWDLGV